MHEWNENFLNIHINFDNPLLVSRGVDRDLVYFKLLYPGFYVSKIGGKLEGNKLNKLSFPR